MNFDRSTFFACLVTTSLAGWSCGNADPPAPEPQPAETPQLPSNVQAPEAPQQPAEPTPGAVDPAVEQPGPAYE